tara:strand:+ start:36 stop:422 length:387 start_codon:yes stop_codon:yes gene_type:complete
MYARDSFFDLSLAGQCGLVALSLLLSIAFLLVARLLLRTGAIWVRLLGALSLYWLFVWLSPQVYYEYYRLLIPSLPAQWVTWPPRTPAEALALLALQGPHSLSAHGQALLGWSLLAAPFVRVSRKRRA